MVDVGDAARVLRPRGDRLSEVDRFEDGLNVIKDGRLGDLLDVVRKTGLGASTKGAVGGGGAVVADVPAGPSKLDCSKKISH